MVFFSGESLVLDRVQACCVGGSLSLSGAVVAARFGGIILGTLLGEVSSGQSSNIMEYQAVELKRN